MDMDMSPLRPQNYLFGCELKADRDYHFKVDNDENEHQLSSRTVSLGAGAKDELHIVEAEAMNYEGSPIKVTLATLKMSVQPTVSLGGFEITPPVVLRLKCGSGPVHISGQHLVGMLHSLVLMQLPCSQFGLYKVCLVLVLLSVIGSSGNLVIYN